MSHLHKIIDTDLHFIIDPITRTIENQGDKRYLTQYDHESERFTFGVPRFIEGHDMTLCDRIEIHFTNITKKKDAQNDGMYVVDRDDKEFTDDLFKFSWKVRRESTQLVGILKFSITFLCGNEFSEIIYEWSTTEYKSIQILPKLDHSEEIVAKYPDLFVMLKREIYDEGMVIEDIQQTITSEESGGINSFTVTLLDGSTRVFNVKNGVDGLPGVYVGSGEPPEDCDIQIDLTGEADEYITKKEFEELLKELPSESDIPEEVLTYTEQSLTEEQQMQVRKNLGLYSYSDEVVLEHVIDTNDGYKIVERLVYNALENGAEYYCIFAGYYFKCDSATVYQNGPGSFVTEAIFTPLNYALPSSAKIIYDGRWSFDTGGQDLDISGLQTIKVYTKNVDVIPENFIPESIARKEELDQLSGQKIDHPSTGQVGQILEIETVDENGKPKTYKAVDKPTGGSGESGADGKDGQDGFSPIAKVTQTDAGATIFIQDKNGTTTATITNGKDGVDGKDGKDGEKGADGKDGVDGYTPVKGKDYFDGEQGPKGDKGDKGEDGKDGTGVTILGSYETEEALKTDRPTGSAGDSYLVAGYLYVWSETENDWKNVGQIQGPKGEKGDTGEQGIQGETGAKGDKGDKGETGDKGADGTSVTVTKVSESSADGGSNVVTFSDGKTLTVKNGSKGTDGKNGQDGKDGSDYILTENDKKEIAGIVEEEVSVGILTSENESPVLGSELATSSGWTTTGWTGDFSNGFTHASGNTNALSFSIPNIAVGKAYVIEFDSSVSYTNTNLLVTIGSAPAMLLYGMSANSTRVGVIAVDTGALTFTPESGFTGKISNISIKEITGVSTPSKTIKDSDGNVISEIRHIGESLFIGKGVGGKTVTKTGDGTDCNFAIGDNSTFQNNISGFWNVAIGQDCMNGNVSGSRNVSIGANNLRNNVEGSRNVSIGNFCLAQAKNVHRTVAIGGDCMSTATGSEDNVAVGFQSLYTNTTGEQNVAIGSESLKANTTGLANVAIGHNALSKVTTGRTNVAIGFGAGKSLTTGNGNIVIGANCDVSAGSYYALNIGNLLKGSVQSGSAYLSINGGLRLPSIGTEKTENNDVYTEEWTFTLEDDSTVAKKVLLV